jgi:hypothetical protein
MIDQRGFQELKIYKSLKMMKEFTGPLSLRITNFVISLNPSSNYRGALLPFPSASSLQRSSPLGSRLANFRSPQFENLARRALQEKPTHLDLEIVTEDLG